MEVGREPGRETGREVVVVVGQVLSVMRFMDSARRREVERPLRKDCADWRDLASWGWMLVIGFTLGWFLEGEGRGELTLNISSPLLRR